MALIASVVSYHSMILADECTLSNDPIEDYHNLIHQAAAVDENGRRTEEEYANFKVKPLIAVQNRFAPTGILKCNGSELSAQLTGGTNVLTTAAHGFYEMETCKKIASPETCTFTVKVGNNERTSRVTGMPGIGTDCPIMPRPKDDWAVLTIDPPLDEITPYHLPDDLNIKEDEEVLSVSPQHRDFYRIDPKTKKKYLPKSIEECQVKKVYAIQRVSLVETNCDMGRGASGSSVLRVKNGRDYLIGITTGNRESEAMLRRAEKRGTPNTGKWVLDKWTTYHVPLNARFLDTVKKAMLDRPI